MIIVNQTKSEIFNFDNIKSIWIGNESPCYSINADGDELGRYNTPERAKEVLQKIIQSYREYRTAECDGYTDVLEETAVFEMPEE